MSKIKMLLDDAVEEIMVIAGKEGFIINEEIATNLAMNCDYDGKGYLELNKMDKSDYVVDWCISTYTNLYK